MCYLKQIFSNTFFIVRFIYHFKFVKCINIFEDIELFNVIDHSIGNLRDKTVVQLLSSRVGIMVSLSRCGIIFLASRKNESTVTVEFIDHF